MKFSEEDRLYLENEFSKGTPTKDVQEYLMKKYGIIRTRTNNFIKKVRKSMGIYNKVSKEFQN